MARSYRMEKREQAMKEIRDRILQATMQLHDEKGPAFTTFADIAERAGVGQATVHRHFATTGELVRNCGMHVWAQMRPPVPEDAAARFAGLHTREEKLARLIAETDAFYERGWQRLTLAARDSDMIPELDGFLKAVGAGIEALVWEALSPPDPDPRAIGVVATLVSLPVWKDLNRLGMAPSELAALKLRLLLCGIAAAEAA